MSTKKKRYMIVLDEDTNNQLNKIMELLNTKQRSKAIKYIIEATKITILLKTIY